MQLSNMTCEVCRAGAPPLTEGAIAELRKQVPLWHIVEECGTQRIEREFQFADFVSAMAFTDRVGELAERNGHHPALLTEWGKVTVQWWTHKVCGLHMNDFIMASKTNLLAL